MRRLTKVEWAYVAGILDGEGCLGVYRGRRAAFEPHLSITNTNEDLILWLQRRIGGRIAITRPVRSGSCKPVLRLHVGKIVDMVHVCRACLPYLVTKWGLAELLIQFQGTGSYRGRKLPNNVVSIRKTLAARTRIINRRGSSAVHASGSAPVHKESQVAEASKTMAARL